MENKMYNLTYPQQNILLVENFNVNSPINSIIGSIEIIGKFDEKLCRKAIDYIIEKNDILRVNIIEKDGEVYQYFEDEKKVNIPVIEMTNFTDKEINDWKEKNAQIKLDFPDTLFQFYILNYGNSNGAIFLKIHHIISDAWGISKLTTQAIKFMEEKIGNNIEEESIYSYIDYIKSENEYTNSEKYKKDEEFWKEYLKDVNEPISIKTKNSKTKKAKRISIDLTEKETEKIIEYCKENKISPYVMFLTALSTYLYRIKDNSDFIIGTPVLNRSNFKEKNMAGMCVSTLPLRIKLEENEKFIDLAKSISSNTFTLFRHQRFPYSKTLEIVHSKTDIKENIYNIMLSYQNAKIDIIDNKKYKTTWPFSGSISDQLQIHITDMDDTGNLSIYYDYLTDLLEENEIKYFHSRLMTIIKDAIENIDVDIEEIHIMSKDEENKILYQFNNTNDDYMREKNVIDLFEEQVKKTPKKTALKFNEKNISYGKLNEKVDLLANKLYNNLFLNVTNSNNIGVIISKKIESIEMILAILKLGYTYVPIDINYPLERIEKIINKANITTCFVDKEDIHKLKLSTNINFIDNSILDKEIKLNYEKITNENLYIIFTSGSTGDPKGVSITNQNIVNLLYSQLKRNLQFENKNILQFATMAFDVSYQEIFSALCFGGTLVLLDEEVKKDSVKLCEYIAQNSIDILFIPPAYLRLICEIENNIKLIKTCVKDIIVAGEQLVVTESIKKLLEGTDIKLHNHYGPAETHVISTITYNYDNLKSINKVSIGKPINNTKILILDKKERLLPIGVQGEIVALGEAVGNGYINDEILTKEVFKIINGNKVYKTGDVGYYSINGILYYAGRKDFQIKHNGYRIEIEEIEKNILRLQYVSDVVIKIDENSGKNEIIAVLELKENVTLMKIKDDLSRFLPEYMIPNKYYLIKKMPLNLNGKVDRKKINIKELKALLSDKDGNEIIEYDKKIIKCIEKTLNVEVTHNFNLFDYGADSLQIIKLQTEFMKKGIMISVQDIYDNPTINEIIRYIKEGNKDDKTNEDNILKNTVNNPKIINKKIKKILITGATGYLGIHVLKEILENNKNVEVISLTRRYIDLLPQQRIKEKIEYYFGKEYVEKYMQRIKVYESNLDEEYLGLEKNIYYELKENVDVVINCAALVSHYASKNVAEKSNSKSIINLIEFVKNTDIILNHISTIGVCGNGLVKNNNCVKNIFSEDDLYIGQEYQDNIYIYTKTMGENLLYNNMKFGNIKVNVLRLGNLTNRFTDYVFQINYTKNAFQSKIAELTKLGYVPKEILNNNYEMTPVDICSENIIKIAFSNRYNGVYHIFNDHILKFSEILEMMRIISGKKIEIVSMEKFKNKLLREKEQDGTNTLFQDILIKDTNYIRVTNEKTKSQGYSNFDKVDNKYYYNVLENIWREINES